MTMSTTSAPPGLAPPGTWYVKTKDVLELGAALVMLVLAPLGVVFAACSAEGPLGTRPPEGGSGGGQIVACGTPEQVSKVKASHTGRALATHLAALR